MMGSLELSGQTMSLTTPTESKKMLHAKNILIFLSQAPSPAALAHMGEFKTAKMNVVDNSALGRKAMAEGRPPKVIEV